MNLMYKLKGFNGCNLLMPNNLDGINMFEVIMEIETRNNFICWDPNTIDYVNEIKNMHDNLEEILL